MKGLRLITFLILTLPLWIMFTNCDHKTEVWEMMDRAESLMTDAPDSSFYILSGIDETKLGGKEEKARFALLMSMAMDKNYIDTTTFDVLQPAIDYYMEHGSADERLRTLYYQGRIYQNGGDDENSIMCFLNASDLDHEVHDSLLLAHNYVALATIYDKQYKIEKFIQSHIKAAEIYKNLNKTLFQIRSHAFAFDGFTMLDNKAAADSLMPTLLELVQNNPQGEAYLLSSLVSYIGMFGTPEETREFVNEYAGMEMSKEDSLDFALLYSKIGEYDKALEVMSKVKIEGTILDSLKYKAIESEIFEEQGNHEHAWTAFKEYYSLLDAYHYRLFSQDLLFADEKHRIEVENLNQLRERDRIIGGSVCGGITLIVLILGLYIKYKFMLSKKRLAEKESENLRLEQENLLKEKERVELERDKVALEIENLRLEKNQLAGERDNLKILLQEQTDLSEPLQSVVKNRLNMLNSLLAKEISKNDNYAKPYNKWIESIIKDRAEFMNSTRLAFTASHPKFIKYLEDHGLNIDEINYLCLYALGLRGKEVGNYIQLKRHYNISSEIRKKLGIDEHETNIGLYIRRKMDEL